jgi:gas vesicle protein
MSDSSFGKFLGGALLGGVLGGLIGLLLAPRSGTETRTLIREEFGTRYRDSADAIQGKIQDKVDHLQERAGHLQDKANEMAETLEQKGQELIGRIREGIRPEKS